MTIEGYGPYQIASKLKEEKVLIPSAYLAQHGEGVNKNKTFKDVILKYHAAPPPMPMTASTKRSIPALPGFSGSGSGSGAGSGSKLDRPC